VGGASAAIVASRARIIKAFKVKAFKVADPNGTVTNLLEVDVKTFVRDRGRRLKNTAFTHPATS
jgi:hypothetical protein